MKENKRNKIFAFLLEIAVLIVVIVNFYVFVKINQFIWQVVIVLQLILLLIARNFLRKSILKE